MEKNKEQKSLVVIGHVDSGKSLCTSHLLCHFGKI